MADTPPSRDDQQRLNQLEEDLQAAQDELRGIREVLEGVEAAPKEPKFAPFYPTCAMWVHDHFCRVYARDLQKPSNHWCDQWWDHAEAIDRLTSLWEVWELTRTKRGSQAWWNAVDHHLPILLSEDGPFSGCETGAHHPLAPFPLQPTPPGWGELDPEDVFTDD